MTLRLLNLLRSRVRSARALSLTVPLLAFASTACSDDGAPTYDGPANNCESDTEVADIDRDGLLELDIGNELAVAVEYTGDGAYRISTTCDSDKSGYGCLWDVLASSVDGTIDSFAGEELERQDFLADSPSTPDSEERDAVRLMTFTESDTDAFTLQTTPGSSLRLEAYLDVKYCAGPYLYWYSGGEVRNSPSTTTEFIPTEE
jgi:hypothetical protein